MPRRSPAHGRKQEVSRAARLVDHSGYLRVAPMGAYYRVSPGSWPGFALIADLGRGSTCESLP